MIAPFAPRDPYNAAAPAPFNTEILAISSGLISDRASPISRPPHWPPPPKLLSTGTPSTTNKGRLFPKREEIPLRTTLEEPSNPVAAFEICRPATFPVREFTKLFCFTLFSSAPRISQRTPIPLNIQCCNHHFLQLSSIFSHDHINLSTSPYRFFHRHHSYIRKYQNSIFVHFLQGIGTIKIGGCTRSCSFDVHRYTDQRVT